MPRPLREPDIRSPTKIQNTFATPVGADLCVGPLHTCRFRSRAHTQVRPYKVGMVVFTDHASEPGGLPPTGGLNCNPKLRPLPLRGFAAQSGVQGHCPCKYKTNAGFDGFPTFCGMDFCAIISAMARVKPRRT